MNMDVLTVFKLIIVGHVVAVQSQCNVLQKCKNCFLTSRSTDICRSDHTPESMELCILSLNNQNNSVNMVAYTLKYLLQPRCFVDTCTWSKFKTSTHNSTTFRLGCERGCNNLTLMHYEHRRVLDNIRPDKEVYTHSDAQCTTLCVETAFNGTDCTVVFSDGICKLYMHTSCGRVDFPHAVKNGSLTDVVTCDYRTAQKFSVNCQKYYPGLFFYIKNKEDVETFMHSECCTPDEPRYGTVTYTELDAGSTVIYTCNQGYSIDGSEVRTCQPNLTWGGISPSCKHVSCGTPQSILNGHAVLTTIAYIVEYVCHTGYIMTGSNVSTCLANDTWDNVPVCTPINCTNPTPISNGNINVSSNVYQDIIQYTCSTGFTLNGPSTRTCSENGSWSGSDPSCVHVDCGEPPVIANGTVTVNTTTYQHYANYTCSTGFVLFEHMSIDCQDSGLWSEPVPYCVVDCGVPDTTVSGNVTYNNTLHGSIANYECTVGCELTGHNETSCLFNGSWSEPAPNCTCTQCEELVTPLNGFVHTTDGRNVNSVATYTCSYGYMLSKKTTRICSTQGMWSSSEPSCELPVQTVAPIFISPCFCHEGTTFGNMSQQEIIDQLVKDTKIDAKSTSKAHRKLISSNDSRQSSTYIGTVGVSVVCVVFGSILLIDCLSLLCGCRGSKMVSMNQRWRKTSMTLSHTD